MPLSLDTLTDAVARHAAIRRTRRLQPAGGPGDKIFPPTYPIEDKARHVFETRRIDGEKVECVLIDSVASQANRLEEALIRAGRAGEAVVPAIETDFSNGDLADLGQISTYEAPHRVFDAIIRDSQHGNTAFPASALGRALQHARLDRATAMLEASPNALLFGAWNSTGEGGGLGAKFPRVLVSEIVGIDAQGGYKVASRIDPVGTSKNVEIFMDEYRNWAFNKDDLSGKSKKKVKPSEINHSNIAPNVDKGGVTIDHARHTAVITLAGLRRLRFPDSEGTVTPERDTAARTLLATMGLYALAAQDRDGYALRSRCDLVPEDGATFELVAGNGDTETFDLDLDAARDLYAEAVAAARAAGFVLDARPTRLTPNERLVELVQKSRAKAEAGQADAEAD